MTVGSTVVKPGQATNFIFPYAMHPGMGGKHHFVVTMKTNDPERPTLEFHIYANSIEEGHAGYFEVTPAQLEEGLKQKNFTLINVHTPFEGRIKGTDLEIPYDQIDKSLDQLPDLKNTPIVLYCRSGRMSEIAAERLIALGYQNVFTLRGGMVAWEEAGFPLETE